MTITTDNETQIFDAQKGADPTTADLEDGDGMMYISDGSGDITGAEGDLVWATNDNGTVKTLVLGAVANATAP